MKLQNHNKIHVARIFLMLSLAACLSGFSSTTLNGAETAGVEKAVRLSMQIPSKQSMPDENIVITVFAENTSRFPVALTNLHHWSHLLKPRRMLTNRPMTLSQRDLFSQVVGEIDDKRAVVKRTHYVDASKFGPVEFEDGSVAAPGRAPRPSQWRYIGKDKLVHFQVLMPGEKTTFIGRVLLQGEDLVVTSEISLCVLDETLSILRRSAFGSINLLQNFKPGDRILADADGFAATSREISHYKWTTVGELAKFKKPFVEGRQPVPNPDTVKLPSLTPNEKLMLFALPRAEFEQLRAGKFFLTSRVSRTVEVDTTP